MITFGAVVLTLNATGCAFLFEMCRARLTCWVRGPIGGEAASAKRESITFERKGTNWGTPGRRWARFGPTWYEEEKEGKGKIVKGESRTEA